MHVIVGAIVGWELGLIVLLVVLLFGSTRLPVLARNLRRVPREFRKGRQSTARDKDSPKA